MTTHEQTWMVFPGAANDMRQTAVTDSQHRMVALTRTEDGPELARLIAAAPDMARAGLLLHARVAEAARSLPSARTAEALAEMDTSVVVPSSIIREVFAALRKAKVLP